MYVSDFVYEGDETIKAPLDLVLCGKCHLVQLGHVGVDTSILYNRYWYRSGVNESMVKALKDIVDSATKLVDLKPGDTVLDIGANDGTLLRFYDENLDRVGFEPAQNLTEEAIVGGNRIIPKVFSYEDFKGKAKIITSIAMFYDLEYPNAFVRDIKRSLADEGVWVIELSYLPSMLEINSFDTICHEHIEYYSLMALESLLERHGLEVFDVQKNKVNGGSFRCYVKHTEDKREIKESVITMREEEKALGLDELNIYWEFAVRVEDIKRRTLHLITELLGEGKTIYVYGASTKGNTLLQYYGLDNTMITAAAERSPEKWGKKTVGSNIPIIPEEAARTFKPDYFLVLPWHFIDGFVEREKDFLERGGHFIQPLPELKIL